MGNAGAALKLFNRPMRRHAPIAAKKNATDIAHLKKNFGR
jgi:hypothetical protein